MTLHGAAVSPAPRCSGERVDLDFAGGLAAAFLSSVIICRVLMHAGPRDLPNEERKAHRAPTPTSGGLGIALAFVLGCLLIFARDLSVTQFDLLKHGNLLTLAGLALALLVIGFLDDAFHIPAPLRFGLFFVISTLGALNAGVVRALPFAEDMALPLPFIVGLAGSALWVFTLVNSVNFIDGANGVAMGSMAFGLTTLAVLADVHGVANVAPLLLACVAAIVGFLVWNFPDGKLFAGDCGALFVGGLGAMSALILVEAGQVSPVVPPIVFFPLLADVLLTLLWRARRGRSLLQPHSDHLYQVGVRACRRHAPVAIAYWGAMAFCGAVAYWVSVASDPLLGWAALAALAVSSIWISRSVRAWAKPRGFLKI